MTCDHQVHKNYPHVLCVLERGHGGMHRYKIGDKLHYIGGCCPDKTVELLL